MNTKESLSLLLLFVLVMLSTSVVHSQSATYAAIPYVPNGTDTQVLNIYLPDTGAGPFPTILEFHPGGGGPGGTLSMRSHLLKQGYALVGVDYDDRDWSQGLEDSFCALAWLHTEGAEYNLDASRTVAFGFSVGGQMVSYLGTVDDPDMFLADCPHTIDDQTPLRGVIDLGAGFVRLDTRDYILSKVSGFSEEAVAAMRESIGQIPINEWADTLTGDELEFARWTVSFWLDGSEPPFLLIHSEMDYTIPHEESIRLAEELEAVGSPVESLLLPDIDHDHTNLIGLPTPGGVKVTETVDAFLEKAFETDAAVDQQ